MPKPKKNTSNLKPKTKNQNKKIMCQIIIKKPGVSMPAGKIADAIAYNPDGSGLWVNGEVYQGEQAEHKAQKLDVTDSAVFHARIATSGKHSRMLHPFYIGSGFYLFHNGTLSGRFEGNNIFSDTAHLAEYMSQKKITRSEAFKVFFSTLPEAIGNRFVVAGRGKIMAFGDGFRKIQGLTMCGTGVFNEMPASKWVKHYKKSAPYGY